jgi:hypothetical protein
MGGPRHRKNNQPQACENNDGINPRQHVFHSSLQSGGGDTEFQHKKISIVNPQLKTNERHYRYISFG